MKLVYRIIGFPFVFALLTLTSIKVLLLKSILFLIYGGEVQFYDRKYNPKSIQELLEDKL